MVRITGAQLVGREVREGERPWDSLRVRVHRRIMRRTKASQRPLVGIYLFSNFELELRR